MDRLYIAQEDDRLSVAAVLIKNKYTVRQGNQRRQGSKSYDYFLEFERNAPVEKAPAKKEDEP